MSAPAYRSPTYYELAAPPELDWRPYREEDYFAYRRQWDERARLRQAGDFPLHLDIDPTNRCNLKCSMCPRTYYLREGSSGWNPEGREGLMEMNFYKDLIRQAVAGGAKSVKLNFLGEPLMHPRLAEMIELASAAGLWTMINTNATLLNEARARELLDSGLTDIFFSFDSPYKAEYEKIRVGASYDKVLDNIRAFMELKGKLGKKAVQTRASMVLGEDLSGESLERVKADYIKLFRDMGVAEIGFGLPSVMGRDYEKCYGFFPGFVCPDLFRRIFIFWDGPAGPCCGDWERKLIVGQASRQSIAEIWRGDLYHCLRQVHCEGLYYHIDACRACSVAYLSSL